MPQLNAVFIPAGVDDLTIRKKLLTEFGIEIGGGLGDFKGKVWRIGLMGASATPWHIRLCLTALCEALAAQGMTVDRAAVMAAIDASLAV